MAYVDVLINYETSLAEVRHQMHSGELLDSRTLAENPIHSNVKG